MTQLQPVTIPDFGVPLVRPPIPGTTLASRCDALYARAGKTWLFVYADREHSANILFLSGFDPRFEEAILLLGSRKPPHRRGRQRVGKLHRHLSAAGPPDPALPVPEPDGPGPDAAAEPRGGSSGRRTSARGHGGHPWLEISRAGGMARRAAGVPGAPLHGRDPGSRDRRIRRPHRPDSAPDEPARRAPLHRRRRSDRRVRMGLRPCLRRSVERADHGPSRPARDRGGPEPRLCGRAAQRPYDVHVGRPPDTGSTG